MLILLTILGPRAIVCVIGFRVEIILNPGTDAETIAVYSAPAPGRAVCQNATLGRLPIPAPGRALGDLKAADDLFIKNWANAI